MQVCKQYEVGMMMNNRKRRIIARHYDLDGLTSASKPSTFSSSSFTSDPKRERIWLLNWKAEPES